MLVICLFDDMEPRGFTSEMSLTRRRHRSFAGAVDSLDDVLHVHLGHVFAVGVCDLLLILHWSSRRLRLLLFLLPGSWSVKFKRLQ